MADGVDKKPLGVRVVDRFSPGAIPTKTLTTPAIPSFQLVTEFSPNAVPIGAIDQLAATASVPDDDDREKFNLPTAPAADPLDPFKNWIGPRPKGDYAQLEGWDKFMRIQEANLQAQRGFGEAWRSWTLADAPILGDVVGVVIPIRQMREIPATIKALERGEEVDDQRLMNLNLYVADTARKSQSTWKGQAGDVTRQMLGFMADIGAWVGLGAALGLGAPGGIIGGAVGTLKGLGTKLMGALAKGAAKKGVTRFLSKSMAKMLSTAPSRFVGRVLAQSIPKGTAITIADTAANAIINVAQGEPAMGSRMAAEIKIDKAFDGEDPNAQTFGLENATWAALGDRWIQYWSEFTGTQFSEELGLPFMRMVARKAGPVAAASDYTAVRKLGEFMNKAITGTWGTHAERMVGLAATAAKAPQYLADKKWASFLGAKLAGTMVKTNLDPMQAWHLMHRAGYDGVIGEMAEERIGGFATGLLGIQGDEASFKNAWDQMWPSIDQLKAEAFAFSLPVATVIGATRMQAALSGNWSKLQQRYWALKDLQRPQVVNEKEQTRFEDAMKPVIQQGLDTAQQIGEARAETTDEAKSSFGKKAANYMLNIGKFLATMHIPYLQWGTLTDSQIVDQMLAESGSTQIARLSEMLFTGTMANLKTKWSPEVTASEDPAQRATNIEAQEARDRKVARDVVRNYLTQVIVEKARGTKIVLPEDVTKEFQEIMGIQDQAELVTRLDDLHKRLGDKSPFVSADMGGKRTVFWRHAYDATMATHGLTESQFKALQDFAGRMGVQDLNALTVKEARGDNIGDRLLQVPGFEVTQEQLEQWATGNLGDAMALRVMIATNMAGEGRGGYVLDMKKFQGHMGRLLSAMRLFGTGLNPKYVRVDPTTKDVVEAYKIVPSKGKFLVQRTAPTTETQGDAFDSFDDAQKFITAKSGVTLEQEAAGKPLRLHSQIRIVGTPSELMSLPMFNRYPSSQPYDASDPEQVLTFLKRDLKAQESEAKGRYIITTGALNTPEQMWLTTSYGMTYNFLEDRTEQAAKQRHGGVLNIPGVKTFLASLKQQLLSLPKRTATEERLLALVSDDARQEEMAGKLLWMSIGGWARGLQRLPYADVLDDTRDFVAKTPGALEFVQGMAQALGVSPNAILIELSSPELDAKERLSEEQLGQVRVEGGARVVESKAKPAKVEPKKVEAKEPQAVPIKKLEEAAVGAEAPLELVGLSGEKESAPPGGGAKLVGLPPAEPTPAKVRANVRQAQAHVQAELDKLVGPKPRKEPTAAVVPTQIPREYARRMLGIAQDFLGPDQPRSVEELAEWASRINRRYKADDYLRAVGVETKPPPQEEVAPEEVATGDNESVDPESPEAGTEREEEDDSEVSYRDQEYDKPDQQIQLKLAINRSILNTVGKWYNGELEGRHVVARALDRLREMDSDFLDSEDAYNKWLDTEIDRAQDPELWSLHRVMMHFSYQEAQQLVRDLNYMRQINLVTLVQEINSAGTEILGVSYRPWVQVDTYRATRRARDTLARTLLAWAQDPATFQAKVQRLLKDIESGDKVTAIDALRSITGTYFLWGSLTDADVKSFAFKGFKADVARAMRELASQADWVARNRTKLDTAVDALGRRIFLTPYRIRDKEHGEYESAYSHFENILTSNTGVIPLPDYGRAPETNAMVSGWVYEYPIWDILTEDVRKEPMYKALGIVSRFGSSEEGRIREKSLDAKRIPSAELIAFIRKSYDLAKPGGQWMFVLPVGDKPQIVGWLVSKKAGGETFEQAYNNAVQHYLGSVLLAPEGARQQWTPEAIMKRTRLLTSGGRRIRVPKGEKRTMSIFVSTGTDMKGAAVLTTGGGSKFRRYTGSRQHTWKASAFTVVNGVNAVFKPLVHNVSGILSDDANVGRDESRWVAIGDRLGVDMVTDVDAAKWVPVSGQEEDAPPEEVLVYKDEHGKEVKLKGWKIEMPWNAWHETSDLERSAGAEFNRMATPIFYDSTAAPNAVDIARAFIDYVRLASRLARGRRLSVRDRLNESYEHMIWMLDKGVSEGYLPFQSLLAPLKSALMKRLIWPVAHRSHYNLVVPLLRPSPYVWDILTKDDGRNHYAGVRANAMDARYGAYISDDDFRREFRSDDEFEDVIRAAATPPGGLEGELTRTAARELLLSVLRDTRGQRLPPNTEFDDLLLPNGELDRHAILTHDDSPDLRRGSHFLLGSLYLSNRTPGGPMMHALVRLTEPVVWDTEVAPDGRTYYVPADINYIQLPAEMEKRKSVDADGDEELMVALTHRPLRRDPGETDEEYQDREELRLAFNKWLSVVMDGYRAMDPMTMKFSLGSMPGGTRVRNLKGDITTLDEAKKSIFGDARLGSFEFFRAMLTVLRSSARSRANSVAAGRGGQFGPTLGGKTWFADKPLVLNTGSPDHRLTIQRRSDHPMDSDQWARLGFAMVVSAIIDDIKSGGASYFLGFNEHLSQGVILSLLGNKLFSVEDVHRVLEAWALYSGTPLVRKYVRIRDGLQRSSSPRAWADFDRIIRPQLGGFPAADVDALGRLHDAMREAISDGAYIWTPFRPPRDFAAYSQKLFNRDRIHREGGMNDLVLTSADEALRALEAVWNTDTEPGTTAAVEALMETLGRENPNREKSGAPRQLMASEKKWIYDRTRLAAALEAVLAATPELREFAMPRERIWQLNDRTGLLNRLAWKTWQALRTAEVGNLSLDVQELLSSMRVWTRRQTIGGVQGLVSSLRSTIYAEQAVSETLDRIQAGWNAVLLGDPLTVTLSNRDAYVVDRRLIPFLVLYHSIATHGPTVSPRIGAPSLLVPPEVHHAVHAGQLEVLRSMDGNPDAWADTLHAWTSRSRRVGANRYVRKAAAQSYAPRRDGIPAAAPAAPVAVPAPAAPASAALTFQIVPPNTPGAVTGMRGPGGTHMNTRGMRPWMPGWLGNPYRWAGNRGPANVTLRQVIDQFRTAFLAKIANDPAFRAAVLELRGKQVSYYRPTAQNHLQVIQEWLAQQPVATPASAPTAAVAVGRVSPQGEIQLQLSWHQKLAAIPDRIKRQQTLAQQLKRIQVPKDEAAAFLKWAEGKTGDSAELLTQYEAEVLPKLEIAAAAGPVGDRVSTEIPEQFALGGITYRPVPGDESAYESISAEGIRARIGVTQYQEAGIRWLNENQPRATQDIAAYESLSVNKGQGEYGEYMFYLPEGFDAPGDHGEFTARNRGTPRVQGLAGWFRARKIVHADGTVEWQIMEIQSELFQQNKGGFETRSTEVLAKQKRARDLLAAYTETPVSDVAERTRLEREFRALGTGNELVDLAYLPSSPEVFSEQQATFLNLMLKDQTWVPVFVNAITQWAKNRGAQSDLVHYTTAEAAEALLRDKTYRFDTDPVHAAFKNAGPDFNRTEARKNRFGGESSVIPITRRGTKWATREVSTPEGTGSKDRLWFDYDQQKWMTVKLGAKDEALVAVPVSLSPAARVLRIMSIADYQKARETFNEDFRGLLTNTKVREQYDAIEVGGGTEAWRETAPEWQRAQNPSQKWRTDKYGKTDLFNSATGGLDRGDIHVLNPRVLQIGPQPQGFTKVRFPTGETAARVEGHQVLADRLTALQEQKADWQRRVDANKTWAAEPIPEFKVVGGVPGSHTNYTFGQIRQRQDGQWETWYREYEVENRGSTPDTEAFKAQEVFPTRAAAEARLKELHEYRNRPELQKEQWERLDADSPLVAAQNLKRVDAEINELKTQGIEKLAPIEAFYEKRVASIVNRMGAQPVTDANGNTWREVTLRPGATASVIPTPQDIAATLTIRYDGTIPGNWHQFTEPTYAASFYVEEPLTTAKVQAALDAKREEFRRAGNRTLAERGEVFNWTTPSAAVTTTLASAAAAATLALTPVQARAEAAIRPPVTRVHPAVFQERLGQRLRSYEGESAVTYNDPDPDGTPHQAIGMGFRYELHPREFERATGMTVAEARAGSRLSEKQLEDLRLESAKFAIRAAKALFPDFQDYFATPRSMIADLSYWSVFPKFKKAMAAVRARDWNAAARELRDSKSYRSGGGNRRRLESAARAFEAEARRHRLGASVTVERPEVEGARSDLLLTLNHPKIREGLSLTEEERAALPDVTRKPETPPEVHQPTAAVVSYENARSQEGWKIANRLYLPHQIAEKARFMRMFTDKWRKLIDKLNNLPTARERIAAINGRQFNREESVLKDKWLMVAEDQLREERQEPTSPEQLQLSLSVTNQDARESLNDLLADIEVNGTPLDNDPFVRWTASVVPMSDMWFDSFINPRLAITTPRVHRFLVDNMNWISKIRGRTTGLRNWHHGYLGLDDPVFGSIRPLVTRRYAERQGLKPTGETREYQSLERSLFGLRSRGRFSDRQKTHVRLVLEAVDKVIDANLRHKREKGNFDRGWREASVIITQSALDPFADTAEDVLPLGLLEKMRAMGREAAERKYLVSSKARGTEPAWFVPAQEILEWWQTSAERQALLDADRHAEPVSDRIEDRLGSLSPQAWVEATHELFNWLRSETQNRVKEPGSVMGYLANYSPHWTGLGFVGSGLRSVTLEVERAIRTAENAARSKNIMAKFYGLERLAQRYDASHGKLPDITPRMTETLYRLLGLDYESHDAAMRDLKSGHEALTSMGVPTNPDFLEVTKIIYHEMLQNETRRRLRNEALDQDSLEVMGAAKKILARATRREYTGRVRGRTFDTFRQSFMVTGRLPAEGSPLDKLHRYVSDMVVTTINRTTLAQMLLQTDIDGRPLVLAVPDMDVALDDSVFSAEVWEEHARRAAAYFNQRLDPNLGIRAAYQKVLNAVGIERPESSYVKVDSPYNSVVAFYAYQKPGGEENILDMAVGGEVAGLLKHIVGREAEGRWMGVPWLKAIGRVNNWMKINSLMFSAFFSIAGAESIQAITTGIHPLKLGGSLWNMRNWGARDHISLREVRRMIKARVPWMMSAIDTMRDLGIKLSDDHNMFDMPQGSLETDVRAAGDAAERTMGPMAAKAVKAILGMPRAQSDFMFGTVYNTIKIYTTLKLMEELRQKAEDAGMPDFDIREAMKPWVDTINRGVGGRDLHRYSYMTPGMRQFLNLAFFSWPWTFSAWGQAGGGALTGPLLKDQLTPEEAQFAFGRMWPTALFHVMFAIPFLIQLSSWLLFSAPDDDDDRTKWDKPFIWQNEQGRDSWFRWYADVTPLMRKMPWYKGDPTGERRQYIRFGKQFQEIFRWFEDPIKAYMSKMSQFARLAFEQATGRSPGSDWGLPFADEGLLGMFTTLKGGVAGSRVGSAAQKLLPFSVLAWARNKDAAPLQLLGPVSKGVSNTRATKLVEEALRVWVYHNDKVKRWKHVRHNLEALVPEVLNAAAANGYDPKKIVTSAKGAILRDLYMLFYRHLNSNNLKGMDEIGKKIARLNGSIDNLRRSVSNRDNIYGRAGSRSDADMKLIEEAFK